MTKLLLILLTAALAAAQAPAVPSPTAVFGFAPGTDKKLADWNQLTSYYRRLAAASNRIRYTELGKTTEGRPFVLVTISAPENLARLADLERIQGRLADARTTTPGQSLALIAQDKAILAITCNIHSNEIASSQTAAEFAYEMATHDSPEVREILQNAVILLVPSLNPDGEQLVVDWYKKTLGTPYEGSDPVVLYQKYVGHDDNRDWYMFTQPETRLTVEKVLNRWHPQILYDVHQMTATGPRLYLPPWVDPIDPNVDPILVQSMNAAGMDTARDLTAEGKTGVLVDGVYDLWSPARQYIVYHGGLRLLTESASVRIATPENIPFQRLGTGIGYDAKVSKWNFPEPWLGGEWHLGDIVNYQLSAFYSIAHNAAHNREQFLTNFYRISQNAITQRSWPFAFVVPAAQADPLATATLLNVLHEGGVEVGRATSAFDAAGRHFDAGSYVIKLAQPYGGFAKSLLEVQRYPNIREYPGGPPQRPYDVTAQTLPLLLGVEAVTVKDAFTAPTVPAGIVTAPAGKVAESASGYHLRGHNNGSLLALFDLVQEGVVVDRLGDGAIQIPAQSGVAAKLAPVAAKFSVDFVPGATPGPAVKSPRIGLYQSWVPQIDEGWTRWIFDQDGIHYTRVVDADLRAGRLNQKFDVLVFPDQNGRSITIGNAAGRVPPEYTGGVGDAGMVNLKAFAEGGGILVALNQATSAFLDWTGGAVTNNLANIRNTDYYCPGSILQASVVDASSPLAWGAAKNAAVFSEAGPAFAVKSPAHSVLDYTADFKGDFNPNDLLLSGWLLGGEKLKGTSALVDYPLGRGHLIFFGFKPQYRAQSESTYGFFFNALLYPQTP